MSQKRDTYKYHQKDGKQIRHTGITTDPERREKEHQERWPNSHLFIVGNRTTEDGARRWESEQRERGKPTETPKRKK